LIVLIMLAIQRIEQPAHATGRRWAHGHQRNAPREPQAVTLLLSGFPEMEAATQAILSEADEILFPGSQSRKGRHSL
jgi:hypothetical protein